MIFNLISNAKWAIQSNLYGSGGSITIKTQSNAQKNLVEFIFTDNGIGISAENQKRIFEPFFTTKPDGLGLGLAIVYNIVKEHQGDIQVESTEGNGASFKISFPAVVKDEVKV